MNIEKEALTNVLITQVSLLGKEIDFSERKLEM
jgi:hypothetical protein